MSFLPHSSRDDSLTHAAPRVLREIDLAPGDWEEVETHDVPVDDLDLRTIASFWLMAALLVLVIEAAPSLEAAVQHFK